MTFRVARLPRPGETLSCRSLVVGYGGKGANQAVAAARLGGEVLFIGSVGNDAHGSGAVKNLKDANVDTSSMAIQTDHLTGTAAIVVDDQGENSIVIAAGANGHVSADLVSKAADRISTCHSLLCQLETPIEAALTAFRIARAGGVRTILTPAPAVPLPSELLELCDVCVLNHSELEILTGRSLVDSQEQQQAAGELRSRGVGTVVLTLGSRGAMILDEAGTTTIPAKAVRPVDTTGAGDAFTAALAIFSAEGLGLRDAAERAATVAAITVTRPGAQSSFPTRREVDAWHDESVDLA